MTRRSGTALLGSCALALGACTTLPAVPRAAVEIDGSADGDSGSSASGGASGHAGADSGSGDAAPTETGGKMAGGSGGAGGSMTGAGGAPGAGGSPAQVISFDATPTTIMLAGSTNASSVSPSIGLGDVDGDRRVDLVVEMSSFSAQVFVNSGSAPFFTTMPAATFQYTGGSQSGTTSSVAVGDIDGDGRNDLAFALTVGFGGGGLPGPLEVLPFLNSGGGAASHFFAATPATTVDFGNGSASSTSSVALADIDGDRKTDLAVVNAISTVGPNAGSLTVSTYLNNGGGAQAKFFATTAAALTTFAAPSQAGNTSLAPPMGLGDINGDGLTDIALLTSVDATTGNVGVSFYLNDAGGAGAKFFATQPALVFQGTGQATAVPSAIALGDVNGDGKADLVVLALPSSDAPTFQVFLYLNTSR